ncbi:helix-turn-helix transcriptional regulator [Paenibacillus sp. SEL3]|jgi:predicted DNA-binding transcriptional regulator YafY|uniref:YafY family transcriptional regulator n=1 Tax=Paenibacillus polymyxa TaxID=1406 RepID=A0A8I1IU16_PAEPO|nr:MULTISPECIES: YafY family protein [Paenibacillus]KAF6575655.1 YafY family transcriptional regulator [Paenibacillus sp. EKM206P]KAF6589287.1 YafY family transcriptional regulator [Paenibacillus sp. EKM205P]MBM0634507.1 YafY family transcriptional regulator [Paenibacillus polymyxa]MBO3284897.1 YafY family transcriptional regulator [Paenibacillus polymyxa]MBP1307626.1 putative DNA-binding transcriptional regulator YafY [Paenibacillus sp. 1182]
MNKTDRLLAILLELQRKDILRAEDLAAIFETSVRTIYRDIQALSESGVPIVGAPGIGYSLMEGYFLPPVSFTAEEAVALLIGTDFIEQKFDTDYGIKAQTSRRKIEAILPESVRREVSRVRTTMRLLAVGEGANHREKTYLETLRLAVLEKRMVRFGYSKRMPEADGNRQSVRVVAPYGLVLLRGSWVLIGQCELRQQLRHFRLSRMDELMVLEDRFHLPVDFHLQDYKQTDDRHVTVRILARSDIADKVKEANNFYMEAIEERADGLHILFRVRQPEELLQWILGWGADMVVLEPESLRERIRAEVEKMLKCY